MSDELTPDTPHVIHVDNHKKFTSPTLAPELVARLEKMLRASPWYRDGWSRRQFRDIALATLRSGASGGLVILGPRLGFDVPPAFEHLFEPIELGTDDERLKTISGIAPTRQERQMRIVFRVLGVIGAIVAVWMALYVLHGGSKTLPLVLLANAALIAVIIIGAKALSGFGATWYLVPGGVAIVRRGGNRGRRLLLRTRFDSVAAIRWVNLGKTVVLQLELWARLGRKNAVALSQREAISFLAAWRSPHRPPTREELHELVG